MEFVSVAVAALLATVVIGWWWFTGRKPQPTIPAPAPAPALSPVPPTDPMAAFQAAGAERLRQASAYLAGAASLQAAEQMEAAAAKILAGLGGVAPATPPRPSGPAPAPTAGGAAAAPPVRPWDNRHLALPGEPVQFTVAAADRTAATLLHLAIEVERQERTGTWLLMCQCGTVVKDGNVRDHLLNCSTCKAAYGLK